MYDMALRAQKERLLAPVAQRHLATVDPNLLSLVAGVVGLGAAAAVLVQLPWLGLLLWLANRLLDGLDGTVARVRRKQSDFGGYLDLFLDFVVYLAIPLAFMAAHASSVVLWGGVMLFGSFVLNVVSWTTLSALLEKRMHHSPGRLTSVEMPAGLVEGAETIVFYALFFLLPVQVGWLFWLMAVLVLFTAGQRLVWAYRHL